MATGHRVTKPKRTPPLPKEVTPTAPYEYVDRWGVQYAVIWSGEKGDPDLRDLHPNLLKDGR